MMHMWVLSPSIFDQTNLIMSGQSGIKLDFCPVNDLTLQNSYFVPWYLWMHIFDFQPYFMVSLPNLKKSLIK